MAMASNNNNTLDLNFHNCTPSIILNEINETLADNLLRVNNEHKN